MYIIVLGPFVEGLPEGLGIPRSLGFKPCASCEKCMPVSDPHADCLKCLGESHGRDKCQIYRGFKHRMRKEWDIKLS